MTSVSNLPLATIVRCARLVLILSLSGPIASFAAVPIAKLTISNPVANEYLGLSLATDGTRVLLGTGSGTAYLFDPFTQQQLAKVTLPDPRGNTSVALEGNSGVVGNTSGAVLYNFSSLPNVTSTQLVPSDPSPGSFGASVDMSGDSIIVGANGAKTAYLFNRQTGAQYAKLNADINTPQSDNFGISVAIDGNLAVVGASNTLNPPDSAVYLFNAQPGFIGNRQLDKFTVVPAIPNPGQNFGYRVDIAGNMIIASETMGRSFLWPTDGEPMPLAFSNSVVNASDPISLSGNFAAVSQHLQESVRFYDMFGSIKANLPAPPNSPIGFGYSVAIGGGLFVVSAPGGAPANSAVYVYRLQDIVPEPCAWLMALFGMVGVTGFARRGQRIR